MSTEKEAPAAGNGEGSMMQAVGATGDDPKGVSPLRHSPLEKLRNVPEELRALPQWCVCGDDKRPMNPRTGQPASVTDPATWGSWDEALAAVGSGRYPRLGFVLTDSDPFTIIDLDDKAERPATEEDRALHGRIREAFPSYTERSTSGRGYHIIVKGSVPKGMHRDNVEVYSRARFMVCTGDVFRDAPITAQQALLDRLCAEMQPAPEPAELVEVEELVSDAALVEMAMNAANADKFNALCNGKWEGMTDANGRPLYPSQSEADHALMSMFAFYTQSNEQVRRLFRYSALGKREKAIKNDKYLDRSIAKLRAAEPPPAQVSPQFFGSTTPPIAAPTPSPTAAAVASRTITLEQLANPPVEHFVCGSLFPFGKASVLYAPQGAGKSVFLSQLAFTFAALETGFASFLCNRLGNPV